MLSYLRHLEREGHVLPPPDTGALSPEELAALRPLEFDAEKHVVLQVGRAREAARKLSILRCITLVDARALAF